MRSILFVGVVLGGLLSLPRAAIAQTLVDSGNVTTIAGSALSGFSGDGGPALRPC